MRPGLNKTTKIKAQEKLCSLLKVFLFFGFLRGIGVGEVMGRRSPCVATGLELAMSKQAGLESQEIRLLLPLSLPLPPHSGIKGPV